MNVWIHHDLDPYRIMPGEYFIMKECMRRGECTATYLGETLPIDNSRISRLVNGLVERGILQRRRLRSDRRVVMLSLTEEGEELTQEIRDKERVCEEYLTQGVSQEEMDALVSVSIKVSQNSAAMKKWLEENQDY